MAPLQREMISGSGKALRASAELRKTSCADEHISHRGWVSGVRVYLEVQHLLGCRPPRPLLLLLSQDRSSNRKTLRVYSHRGQTPNCDIVASGWKPFSLQLRFWFHRTRFKVFVIKATCVWSIPERSFQWRFWLRNYMEIDLCFVDDNFPCQSLSMEEEVTHFFGFLLTTKIRSRALEPGPQSVLVWFCDQHKFLHYCDAEGIAWRVFKYILQPKKIL